MLSRMRLVFLSFILSFSLAGHAFAQNPAEQVTKSIEVTQDEQAQKMYLQAIQKLEKHVLRNQDGTFQILISQSKAEETLQIENGVYIQIQKGMESINLGIQKGLYYSDANRRVFVKGSTYEENLTRGGKNAYELHWWGILLYLDSTYSQKLAGLLRQGAGAVAIAGLISRAIPGVGTAGSIVLGVASGLANFQSGRILNANATGRGVKLYYVGGPGSIPAWVESQ